MPGCEILEYNIQIDHLHMLMVIPPKYAVSEVIGEIKQYTASKLREKFAWLEKVYRKERVVWSPGYFASNAHIVPLLLTIYSAHPQQNRYNKWYTLGGQAKEWRQSPDSILPPKG